MHNVMRSWRTLSRTLGPGNLGGSKRSELFQQNTSRTCECEDKQTARRECRRVGAPSAADKHDTISVGLALRFQHVHTWGDRGQRSNRNKCATWVNFFERTSKLSCYLHRAVHRSGEKATSGHSQSCDAALMSEQGLGADHVVHAPHLNTHTHTQTQALNLCIEVAGQTQKPIVFPHPQRTVVGGTEHFGLVGRGDDSESINRPHVTCQGPHLLFGLNVPHLDRTHTHTQHLTSLEHKTAAVEEK